MILINYADGKNGKWIELLSIYIYIYMAKMESGLNFFIYIYMAKMEIYMCV